MSDFTGFSDSIILWYELNKRDLPWRKTKDPYLIWVSEIILQQTRVNQGIPYYLKICSKFPNVNDFANADIDTILKMWQGLGYYSRARNMHIAANQVINDSGGVFPKSYSELIKLKGVGRYTAAAISSISGNESIPVIDGNVFRVLSRYFGISTNIASHSAYFEFFEISKNLMGKANPGNYNQAIMELGAIICTPLNYSCNQCPINFGCHAYTHKSVSKFPIKKKNIIPRKRYFNYIVLKFGDYILMKQRLDNDIWNSLYDFPLIETTSEINLVELQKENKFIQFEIENLKLISISKPIVHKLTHQTILAIFYCFEIPNIPTIEGTIKVNYNKLRLLAVPRLIEKYLKNEFGVKK